MYGLDDSEKWTENGFLNYNTTLRLMFCCRRMNEWDKVLYVDLFFTLCNDHDTRKKCKLLDNDANSTYVLAKSVWKKPRQRFCSSCDIG